MSRQRFTPYATECGFGSAKRNGDIDWNITESGQPSNIIVLNATILYMSVTSPNESRVRTRVLTKKQTDMKELEKRIFVDEEIILNEYDYTFGEKKSVEVYYSLLNVKTDKLTRMYADTYNNVLRHTRERARDGRYKNFEFLISLDLL